MRQQLDRSIPLPLYQKVKDHILDQVRRGQLKHGVKIPSEAELVERFGVSRMTVHRALRELAAAGVVDRVQGLGTFVSAPPVQTEFLELKDIADDIKARGNVHTQKLRLLETVNATAEQGAYFDRPRGARLFHSIIVNYEDGVPVQVENRLILPSFAPGYLEHDFQTVPSTRYLRSIADATKVEHVVCALMADVETCELLEFSEPRSVMMLTRRTWVGEQAVSRSVFTYPGGTYCLVSRRSLD
ncbi:transcriptional regulator, GntR family (plasmid) [Rhizobium leguminosarum bv. trifolii WSM2304]|uniref:Transcriptional regulator, GntR family n=1 Tax=Rhizobium leguminosarum bv. trifolii (strain WSM2304) TaxID=395492 RepID=A0ABF7QVB9_RHILW|nr:UTRA domain-containing protein [Rhizobium leguminosarum]ACI58228.1 transcriptional regulator, GntR family [Rhizobium leguminosarum bv. trifolii WSM2304]